MTQAEAVPEPRPDAVAAIRDHANHSDPAIAALANIDQFAEHGKASLSREDVANLRAMLALDVTLIAPRLLAEARTVTAVPLDRDVLARAIQDADLTVYEGNPIGEDIYLRPGTAADVILRELGREGSGVTAVPPDLRKTLEDAGRYIASLGTEEAGIVAAQIGAALASQVEPAVPEEPR
jgi:hypothetical protein